MHTLVRDFRLSTDSNAASTATLLGMDAPGLVSGAPHPVTHSVAKGRVFVKWIISMALCD
jgi:hypothetical protein